MSACTCTGSKIFRLASALAIVAAVGSLAVAQNSTTKAQARAADTTTAKTAPKSDPYPLATCPVSGRPLGDKPVIMEIDGREYRFCCNDCPEKFKADPAKYIPAIDKAIVEQQKAFYPLTHCVVMTEDELVEGEAVDYVYNNRLVRFCCKGCIKKFNQDPKAFLAKLDAAVVEAQLATYPIDVCVISGEKLGGMGEPVNMVVNNRLVRLCCKGCEKSVRKDPAAALAKLEKK
ncbi:MAG: hypothetical protein KDA22_10520 [Phycisphaerales bacterium]|nr:hypothetical protein [Phycisphaerales bacterium]